MRFYLRRRYLYYVVMMLLVLGAILYSYFAHLDWLENPFARGYDGTTLPGNTSAASEEWSGPAVKITPETKVIYRRLYAECGHEESETVEPGPELIGLDREAVEQIYSSWDVVRFDSSVVELVTKLPGFCPEMKDYRFIGLKDGRVVVFYGKPRPEAPVYKVTDIEEKWLHPSDLERLRQGIVIEADKEGEIWRFLEGLAE